MKYQFGDSNLAAHRLEVLHNIYADSTRSFLLGSVKNRPGLALDLGCGPGFTTHFLANVLQCDRTVGIDSSDNFISVAGKTETKGVSFCHHDITAVPFPVGPADLLFCRYLLSHLQHPLDIVAGWGTQLHPRGLLLMEETECIHTANEVFALYLNIVDAMLEDRSSVLYIGRLLDSMEDTTELKRRTSGIGRVRVSNHRAATMFYMNIQTWKQQPFIQENYPVSLIRQLEADLKSMAERSTGETDIEWELRQIVFERV